MAGIVLKNHPHAQCKVHVFDREHGKHIIFQSYNTEVIFADYDKHTEQWLIGCTGLYSRTTIKQIGWFLKEYLPMVNYYDIKHIVELKVDLLIRKDGIKEYVTL